MPGTMTPKKGMKKYKRSYTVDNKGMVNIMPKGKKKVQYKAYGGKIGDGNYKSCGANIVRTK